jgi:Fe-S-cluster containining protein
MAKVQRIYLMVCMTIKIKNVSNTEVTCSNCQACCCRLEVMILTDTGVPQEHISVDEWGAETMLRLDDGWCSAVDRETLMCTIYENRPWVCREFEMGSYECKTERDIQFVSIS